MSTQASMVADSWVPTWMNISCSIFQASHALSCDICNMWVHIKCTNLSMFDYDFHRNNVNEPYICVKCDTQNRNAANLSTTIASPTNSSSLSPSSSTLPPPELDISSSSCDTFYTCHSSDFELLSDSDVDDLNSRGLNFNTLPSNFAKFEIPS